MPSRVFQKVTFFNIAYLFVTKIPVFSRTLNFQRLESNVIAYLSMLRYGYELELMIFGFVAKNALPTALRRHLIEEIHL